MLLFGHGRNTTTSASPPDDTFSSDIHPDAHTVPEASVSVVICSPSFGEQDGALTWSEKAVCVETVVIVDADFCDGGSKKCKKLSASDILARIFEILI